MNNLFISLVVKKNKYFIVQSMKYKLICNNIKHNIKYNTNNNIILINNLIIKKTNEEWKYINEYEEKHTINKNGVIKSKISTILNNDITQSYKNIKYIDIKNNIQNFLIHNLVLLKFTDNGDKNRITEILNKNEFLYNLKNKNNVDFDLSRFVVNEFGKIENRWTIDTTRII